jgi:cellulose synthase/poly-beta-1,6-N-acetylglucosamine synthase-like glycosyltransferase
MGKRDNVNTIQQPLFVTVIMSVYKETVFQISRAVQGVLDQEYKYIEFVIILDNPEHAEARMFLNQLEKKNMVEYGPTQVSSAHNH